MSKPLEGRAWLDAWQRECREWIAICDELIAAGKRPTAYQVSLEQRKRMLARGQRPIEMPR